MSHDFPPDCPTCDARRATEWLLYKRVMFCQCCGKTYDVVNGRALSKPAVESRCDTGSDIPGGGAA